MVINANNIARWRNDPVAFIGEVLRNSETKKPFELNRAQRRFLSKALTLAAEGRLPYAELIFSAPKKPGKTTFAAMIMLYVILCLGGPYAEGYCVANDLEQAQGRVFQHVVKIVKASPLLRGAATVTVSRVMFVSTGATITALASDYAGAAGANPTIICFDELWAYTSERARRLWDEMIPVPTRKVSVRLTVTYAGFSGESKLLEDLYRRGLKGAQIAPSLYEQPGLLMAWHHEQIAPWCDARHVEQMRQQLPANQFLRMIENKWVTSESTFIDMEWWDACTTAISPILRQKSLPVFVGVDASTKRDSTALVACTWQEGKVRVVAHKIFQPTREEPLDFEHTIVKTLLEWRTNYSIRSVLFDPYQMVSTAQQLHRAGLSMKEFPQTASNLTEASSALYDVIKGRNLVVYPDHDLRLAISRAVAVESPRGWRIAKEQASHKIDVVVALAQAVLCTMQDGPTTFDGAELRDALRLMQSRGPSLSEQLRRWF